MKMKMMLFVVAIIALATAANAEIINVNMYASSGAAANKVPQDATLLEGPAGGLGETWNQFNVTSGIGLLDSTGAATTVGFTNNVGSGWLRNGDLEMLKAERALFGKGGDTTHTINGLIPGDLYNVWIASSVSNDTDAEAGHGEWSTSNATTSASLQAISNFDLNTTTWEYGSNYVLFENVVADNNGEITFLGDATDADEIEPGSLATRLGLSGWQIETVIAPTNPSPDNGALIPSSNPLTLSWTNVDPNLADATDTYVQVLFGTDPENLSEQLTVPAVVSTVDVDASVEGTYYWRVDSYRNGNPATTVYTQPVEPNVLEGILWTFDTLADVPPTVAIDTPDQMTWSGEPVQLTAIVTDDGNSDVTISWTHDSVDPNIVVTIVDGDTAIPTVTIDKPDAGLATITLTVAVNDASSPTLIDTASVQIDVYDDACNMARAGQGLFGTYDRNFDCVTDLLDFAGMAEQWLVDYSATGPTDK